MTIAVTTITPTMTTIIPMKTRTPITNTVTTSKMSKQGYKNFWYISLFTFGYISKSQNLSPAPPL
jgi:hypothetical protein